MTWVLVVDDDLYMRRLVERVLRDDGLDVRSAANGSEALGSLDGEQPDAIVLDLIMPVMDGKTFVRNARDAGVTSPVLILAATGARMAAAELSADGYLGKPFEPIRLCAAVTPPQNSQCRLIGIGQGLLRVLRQNKPKCRTAS